MKILAATVLAAGLAFAATSADAAATFDYIFDGGTPYSVSTDGSVVAGYTSVGSADPFRWTQATGLVSLGRHQYVGGAGVPAISSDGTKLACGIGSLDSSYTTQGLWTLGSGWQELMPPAPPDGHSQDGSWGSVWALSGDGATVVGLYNRQGVGRAHASKWTQETGVVDLGGMANGQAGRANCVNNNGTVIGGWVETPLGPWRPAAWVDGSLVLLTNFDGATNQGVGEVRVASKNGNYLAGFVNDPVSNFYQIALWTRTGGVFGPAQFLGYVDGTEPNAGRNVPYGVSEDGRIVIGYTSWDGSPFGTTGFVWTQQTGAIDVNVFLANNGVFVDPNFTIQGLSAMTPDGTQIFGYGQMLVAPYTKKAFRITLPGVLAATPSPPGLSLSAPIPNPSSSGSRLEFSLAQATDVDLSIFDAAGRHVVTLVHGELPGGPRNATWNGRNADGETVGPGVYFARLFTSFGTQSQRILRLH